MIWNWEQKDWPNFSLDTKVLEPYEADFLHKSGMFLGAFTHIREDEKQDLLVNFISDEAVKTSAIEGEVLNRDSVQSSIRRNLGLASDLSRASLEEKGISEMMVDLYKTYHQVLSRDTLYDWDSLILYGKRGVVGNYREDEEPMQVVSGSIYEPKVHFEAPPSSEMNKEMKAFINWFNASDDLKPLAKAAIAHLYFVSIHPFEDGNGRIARALSEKVLAQSLGQPSLIALSITIEKNRKQYYKALEQANKDLEITAWIEYFAQTVIAAQEYSQKMVEFLIKKSKLYKSIGDKLNERQKKVVDRIFAEGLEGFRGGLSAENYISITKTSRATATRDLQDLLEKKVLCKEGELKGTRYYLGLD